MPPPPVDVCVVGGGIGGAALARLLGREAPHLSCVLLERDPSFHARAQGYGLTLQQGGAAMRRLGLTAALAEDTVNDAHFVLDERGGLRGGLHLRLDGRRRVP